MQYLNDALLYLGVKGLSIDNVDEIYGTEDSANVADLSDGDNVYLHCSFCREQMG